MLIEVLWANKNQGELSHLKHNQYFIAQKYITSVDDSTPLPSCHPFPSVLNTPTPLLPPNLPNPTLHNPTKSNPNRPNLTQSNPNRPNLTQLALVLANSLLCCMRKVALNFSGRLSFATAIKDVPRSIYVTYVSTSLPQTAWVVLIF